MRNYKDKGLLRKEEVVRKYFDSDLLKDRWYSDKEITKQQFKGFGFIKKEVEIKKGKKTFYYDKF